MARFIVEAWTTRPIEADSEEEARSKMAELIATLGPGLMGMRPIRLGDGQDPWVAEDGTCLACGGPIDEESSCPIQHALGVFEED